MRSPSSCAARSGRAIRATPGSKGTADRFWGRFGSAGLLVHDPAKGVLLQHRALWSDKGGTWGLPGGALHQGEEAVHGALREAKEEAAVPPESLRVLFTSVFDVGYWSYTTVVAQVVEAFEPGHQRPGKPRAGVGADRQRQRQGTAPRLCRGVAGPSRQASGPGRRHGPARADSEG